MKKIISLVSAFAIASSMMLTASAELAYNGDVVTLPTQEELAARTPVITLSAKPTTNKQDIVDAGIPTKQAGSYINADYDTYIVTMTASNLGDLAVGYTDGDFGTQTGVCLPAIKIGFDYAKASAGNYLQKYKVASASFSSTKAEGVDGNFLNMVFGSPTDMTYCYPAFDVDANGQKISNATVTGKMIFCVTKGKAVELATTKATVTYTSLVGAKASATIISPSVATLTLGSTTPTGPSYSITKEYKDAANKGYVWDVTISDFNTTKNSAMANFKVSDDEKASAEITGLDGIESDGSCNFAVILNTEKTLAATDGFTITFPAK